MELKKFDKIPEELTTVGKAQIESEPNELSADEQATIDKIQGMRLALNRVSGKNTELFFKIYGLGQELAGQYPFARQSMSFHVLVGSSGIKRNECVWPDPLAEEIINKLNNLCAEYKVECN